MIFILYTLLSHFSPSQANIIRGGFAYEFCVESASAEAKVTRDQDSLVLGQGWSVL